jgi:hypothetical protein
MENDGEGLGVMWTFRVTREEKLPEIFIGIFGSVAEGNGINVELTWADSPNGVDFLMWLWFDNSSLDVSKGTEELNTRLKLFKLGVRGSAGVGCSVVRLSVRLLGVSFLELVRLTEVLITVLYISTFVRFTVKLDREIEVSCPSK